MTPLFPRPNARSWVRQPLQSPHWAGASVALALLCHAPALPWWAWPVFLAGALCRRLPLRAWASALRIGLLVLVYAGAAVVWGWADSTSLRLALLSVLVLKWSESRSASEFATVGTTAVLACAIGLLHWGEAWGVGLALASVLLLVALQTTVPPPGRPDLRAMVRLVLSALPMAAVLFVFFPRIPGPLWDIGLSFGLPLPVSLEKSAQGLGASSTLQPGQTQTGALEGQQPVLVAEFANWVPPTSMLYWRGPVFYDFDGQQWKLDADMAQNKGRQLMAQGWRRGSDFANTLAHTAQEIHYRIRLTPHNALWLYGLDVPVRLTSESFISTDRQVLSHTPVRQEMHYELRSALEWTDRTQALDATVRTRALALPAASNPRLQAQGQQWQREVPPEQVIERSLRALAQGGFQVRDRFAAPTGADMLDQFWFDTKEGNSELFASAYVLLMRSAGVPARLVSGYRGGKLMALTDYVVVKRSHAHAWAEVWHPTKGWMRIDPSDIVQPDTAVPRARAPAPVATPVRPPQTPDTAPAASTAPPPMASSTQGASPPAAGGLGTVQMPDLAELLMRWVFKLDAELQKSLLPDENSGSAWIWLLVAALLGVVGTAMSAWGWQRWRDHRRLPRPQRAWQTACEHLARRGWPMLPHECPQDYARRVRTSAPVWGNALQQLADAFSQWRYGAHPDDHAQRVVQAARLLNNYLHSAPTGKTP